LQYILREKFKKPTPPLFSQKKICLSSTLIFGDFGGHPQAKEILDVDGTDFFFDKIQNMKRNPKHTGGNVF